LWTRRITTRVDALGGAFLTFADDALLAAASAR
jgi:hypothetical protein